MGANGRQASSLVAEYQVVDNHYINTLILALQLTLLARYYVILRQVVKPSFAEEHFFVK